MNSLDGRTSQVISIDLGIGSFAGKEMIRQRKLDDLRYMGTADGRGSPSMIDWHLV